MKQGASPVGRRSRALGLGCTALLLSWALPAPASATILYGPTDVGLIAPDRFTSFEGSPLAPGAASLLGLAVLWTAAGRRRPSARRRS